MSSKKNTNKSGHYVMYQSTKDEVVSRVLSHIKEYLDKQLTDDLFDPSRSEQVEFTARFTFDPAHEIKHAITLSPKNWRYNNEH